MNRITYRLEFIGDDVTKEFDTAFHTLRRELRPKDPWFSYFLQHPDRHQLYISAEELDEQERIIFALQTGYNLKICNITMSRWMDPGEFQLDMNIPND